MARWHFTLRHWLAAPLLSCVVQWVSAGEADAWLRQLSDAAQTHAYSGTMVISVGEQMATARVAHAVKDGLSLDRIEVLTGEPRTTYRRGSEVVTVWPKQGLWVKEWHQDLGVFAALSRADGVSVDGLYRLGAVAPDRVAGRVAQVLELQPRDDARWGYRIWRDVATGLMLKVQTLSNDLQLVLEQTAFTSLDTAPDFAHADWLQHLPEAKGMRVREGKVQAVKPKDWGLSLPNQVKGFVLRRAQLPAGQGQPSADHPLQWIFSDGLASVSVFYQPMEVPATAVAERVIRMGATHTLLRETQAMRLTVVGEAPVPTLRAFADALMVQKTVRTH